MESHVCVLQREQVNSRLKHKVCAVPKLIGRGRNRKEARVGVAGMRGDIINDPERS